MQIRATDPIAAGRRKRGLCPTEAGPPSVQEHAHRTRTRTRTRIRTRTY